MNSWPYIIAAYALSLSAIILLIALIGVVLYFGYIKG